MIAYIENNIYLAFCLYVSRILHNVLSERFAQLLIVMMQKYKFTYQMSIYRTTMYYTILYYIDLIVTFHTFKIYQTRLILINLKKMKISRNSNIDDENNDNNSTSEDYFY